MNDRFRFRAWNKEEKQLYYDAEDTYDCLAGKPYPIGASYFGCLLYNENWIVEQCTGLKDKNGKLIYENDIIDTPNGIYRVAVDDFGLWTAIYKGNPLKDVVEWSDIVKNYAFNKEKVEIVILGNIHQDKELLDE